MQTKPFKREKWENPNRAAASGPQGILADLWVQILRDSGMKNHIWDQNMRTYIESESDKAGGEMNRVTKTSIRGNLTKAFTRHYMTWKVFFKGLKWLRWRRFRIIIIGERADKSIAYHESRVVNLIDIDDDDEHRLELPTYEVPEVPFGNNPTLLTPEQYAHYQRMSNQ